MVALIGDVAKSAYCAIYNDLSHMCPYYLNPGAYGQLYIEEEILYHKRNIILLSLYFDKIIICTDNISAFTKYTSKDIISGVVMSNWFMDLVDSKIIILAGWGSVISSNMMANQIAYSKTFRPELKEPAYNDFLYELSERSQWTVREPSAGEADHVKNLLPLVRRLEGVFDSKETNFLLELINYTNEIFGHVGSMEIFPFIDDLFGSDGRKSDAFYRAYYASWHEYCSLYYNPAIPIHTKRIWLPQTRITTSNTNRSALSALYSPDIFERYLIQRFGNKLFSKILAVEINQLLAIRNGDWTRFRKKYHEYLVAASQVCWIIYHPNAHQLLENDDVIDRLISEIIKSTSWDADLSSLGGIIDSVLRLAFGASGLTPLLTLFRKQINKRIETLFNRNVIEELEPYLAKLKKTLESDLRTTPILSM